MASQCTWYFEVSTAYDDGIDSYKAGVYSAEGYMHGFMGSQSRLAWNSSRVWCQGPQGGVQVFRAGISIARAIRKNKYVTNNAELMQEFAWVKLRAKALGLK